MGADKECKLLVAKLHGTCPIGRPRTLEDSIKTDLRKQDIRIRGGQKKLRIVYNGRSWHYQS
jgi:hypothetical protein